MDGLVYVKGNVNLNEIVLVVIIVIDDYDLYGMIVEEVKVF